MTAPTHKRLDPNEARETGGRTLEVFSDTPRLNAWMYADFEPYVRGRVLEVGSGIGNLSSFLVRDAERAVLTDVEDGYLEELQRRWGDDPRVEIERFELGREPPAALRGRRFDAVLSANVIEHVEDDARAVATLADLLAPGGHLLVYVPACPAVYGTVDEALGHYRRYTKTTFGRLLERAALQVEELRYKNLLGLAGWMVNGRVVRRRTLPPRQVALFEKLVPLVRLEERLPLPIGLGLVVRARKTEMVR